VKTIPVVDATKRWSHRCTACGKCCNSAPRMTLPELFHHQHRFIGALAIGRTRGGVSLATQAIDYPSIARCPALADDGLCAIHADRKPIACAVVPFDAQLPDDAQHTVLAARATHDNYIGADCIRPARDGDAHLAADEHGVVDVQVKTALAAHRQALADDRRWWGDSVQRGFLHDAPDSLSQLPADGVLTLPLAPALLKIASASTACRDRCLAYLDAQQALIGNSIVRALARRQPVDRAFTQHLRGFAGTTAKLQQVLRQAPRTTTPDASAIERWLGVSPTPIPFAIAI